MFFQPSSPGEPEEKAEDAEGGSAGSAERGSRKRGRRKRGRRKAEGGSAEGGSAERGRNGRSGRDTDARRPGRRSAQNSPSGSGHGRPELITAMPRQAVVDRGADDRMPEGVAFPPLLEDARPQGAVQRVEQHGDRQ